MYNQDIKTCVLGAKGSGKTQISLKLVNSNAKFNERSPATIGANYYSCNLYSRIKLNIWDTSGNEQYSQLLPIYTRGSNIILYVLDLENPDFNALLNLSDQLQNAWQCEYLMIIGSKSDTVTDDKRNEKLQFLTDLSDAIAQKYPDLKVSHTTTSAKKNDLGNILDRIRQWYMQEKQQQVKLFRRTIISTDTQRAYDRIYNTAFFSAQTQQDNPGKSRIVAMTALLRDYVGTSLFKKACHFRRHHRDHVVDVLRKIQKGSLKTNEEVIDALLNVPSAININYQGSLARRIRYMIEKQNPVPGVLATQAQQARPPEAAGPGF